MVVVAIIGILAATAIPKFLALQLRSKTAEAKGSLQAIRTAEAIHLAEFGSWVAASPSPAAYGGTSAIAFVDTGTGSENFATIGWVPCGLVFLILGDRFGCPLIPPRLWVISTATRFGRSGAT
jgi:type II secretory pathway pseudopilin PulG